MDAVQSASKFFVGFNQEEIQVMAPHFIFHEYKAGEYVMKRNREASYVAIVLSGGLEAEVDAHLKMPVNPGDFVGEVSLFKTGSIRSADVKGTQDGVIAAITFESLQVFGV